MAKNFVQVGENLTLPVKKDTKNNELVKSGELVKVGDVIGVALTDAKTDDGENYYTTIATKGVWNLTLDEVAEAAEAGHVVFATPKGGDAKVPVGFALESVKRSDTSIVVPVLLCLGLAYGAANPANPANPNNPTDHANPDSHASA